MRQTIREVEVNIAYRWFLGLDFYDKVPHFSTFGKNYERSVNDKLKVDHFSIRINRLLDHF